jgi:hypothetical protein
MGSGSIPDVGAMKTSIRWILRPRTIISRFRKLAAAFGDDYRGAHAFPVEGGHVFEVRLRRGNVTVFWEAK